MTARECNVRIDEPPGSPVGKTVPTIPMANDLASALAAIDAIRRWIASQQQPPRTREGGNGNGGGGIIPKPQKQPKPQVGRWNEVHRSTKTVKIRNPDNADQFVEVEQITQLTMKDSLTGEKWIWTL